MKLCLSKFVVFVLILQYISNGAIIPDPYNPVLVNKPNKDQAGQTLIFKFSLPLNSKGLTYKQVIGVGFPSNANSITLNLENGYTCSLTDNNGVNVPVGPVPYEATNIFCELIDMKYTLSAGSSYTLTIKLSDKVAFETNNKFNQISLFTATNNKPERILIDYNPVFADLALYPSYKSMTPKFITIQDISTSISPVSIFYKFDLTISFRVGQYIDLSLLMIVFKFPSHVSKPLTISSNDSSLKGKIELLNLGNKADNNFYLSGVEGNLDISKIFQLTFRSIDTGDTVVLTSLFEVYVYYKNTYSVLSQDQVAFPLTQPIFLSNLSVNHPEGWDIYEGSAWPILISFPISKLSSGGYVVIQQNNTILRQRKINFIASTCDFSFSSDLSQEFGVRPVCFPLRNDHNYPGQSTTTDFKGSGVVFKIPPLFKETQIKFRVMGYAESCGNSQLVIPEGTNFNFVNFSYTISVYKSIDMAQFNEYRFNAKDIIATSTDAVVSANKCYSNISRTASGNLFNESDYPTSSADTIMFKEITDFSLGITYTDKVAECNDCFISDISTKKGWSYGSLMNPSKRDLSLAESYISLSADFDIPKANNPRNMISLPIVNNLGTWAYQSGRLSARFSKDFINYNKDNTNCFMTWGLVSAELKSQNILLDTSTDSEPKTGVGKLNIIGNMASPSAGNGFDKEHTSFNGPFILSSKYDNLGGSNFKFINDYAFADVKTAAIPDSSFNYFTNCFTFNKTFNFKSIYDYLEIDIFTQVGSNPNTLIPNRFNRFFKFVNEIGILDFTQTKATNIGVTWHMVSFPFTYQSGSFPILYNNAVCLLQLSMADLKSLNTDYSNVLTVFINNMNLLDVDYSDVSSNYPVSVPKNVNVYALTSSSTTMGINDGSDYTKTINIYDYFANSSNPIGYTPTTYYQFLSNVLLFTNFNSGNLTNDILIPTYCPLANTPADAPTYLTAPFYLPTVSIQYANGNNHLISKVSSTLKTNAFSFFTPSINLQNKRSVAVIPMYTTLRYQPYTNKDGNSLFIIPNAGTVANNNSPVTPAQAYNCSAFMLFLSKNMKVETTSKLILNSQIEGRIFKNYNNSLFYVFGKPFYNAIYSIIPTQYKMPYNPNNSNAIYYLGIPRPNISDFNLKNDGQYITTDALSFNCVSSGVTDPNDNHFFSNYNTNLTNTITTPNTKYFILDWNPDITTTWQSAVLGSDKQGETLFKNDVAGNIKLTYKLPASAYLPINTVIRFTAASAQTPQPFNTNTLCGIIGYNGITNSCSSSPGLNNSFDCVIPLAGIDINICCYNVNTTADTFTFPTTDIVLPNYTVNNLSTQMWSNIYKLTNQNINWTTNNGSGIDLAAGGAGAASYAKFTNVTYSYSLQEGAYSKATFNIALPREVVRNSKIVIWGDLSKITIPMISPLCSVTFGGYNSGDMFIDSCKVFLPNNIEIVLKNLLYNCGATFSKTLAINIWPITATTYTSSNSGTFSIRMYLNSGEPIANPLGLGTLSYSGPSLQTQAPITQLNNLCVLSNIFPLTAGEVADYTFSFDISTNRNVIPTADPINEILIFFPVSSYPQAITTIHTLKCYYLNNPMICNIIEDNWLSISLYNKITLPSSNFSIVISGIINPANNSQTFACSLNNISTTGTRKQIINGTGNLTQRLSDPETNGLLNLFSISTTDPNPRSNAITTIKIKFDTTHQIASQPKLITDYPMFLITIPKDYNMILYSNLDLSKSTISEVYIENAIVQKLEYKTSIIEYSGNRIKLQLDSNSITLNPNFMHWQINLVGLYNPMENVETTGRFRITLTNKLYSFVYRTYSNLNNISNELLKAPLSDWILFGKGIKYQFDNKKWTIDIISKDRDFVLVKPGRFTKYIFKVKQITANIPHATTNIELKDTIFATDLTTYTIVTAKEQVSFWLGTPCGTGATNYTINFKISNTDSFYAFPAIQVTVDKTVGSINIPFNLVDVVRSGGTFLTLSLSEPSFSEFVILWSQADGSKNDSTANIGSHNVKVMNTSVVSSFSISNKTAVGFQNFQATNPNMCYTMNYSSLTYNVNAENNDLPFGYSIIKLFSFYNGDTDKTIPKNSIRIAFKPDIAPLYLYCALVCSNMDFPDDTTIMNNSNLASSSSPLYGYYTGYIPVSIGSYDIMFNNLIRGMQYKLKCVAKTTLTENPKTVTGEMTSLPDADGLVSSILVANQTPTSCLYFGFISDPTTDVKKAIFNYCQKRFAGYLGCTICKDDSNNITEGLTFSQNVSCLSDKVVQPTVPTSTTRLLLEDSQLDSLRQSYTTTENNLKYSNDLGDNSYFYLLCAVQDKLCSNNVSFPDNYNDIIRSMIYNLRDANSVYNSIGIEKVPVNTVQLISDTISPDITKLPTKIINTPSFNTDGTFSIMLSSPDINLFCYWKIDSYQSPPAYTTIIGCNDAWCGNLAVYTQPVIIKNNPDNIRVFTTDTYVVWVACYNNVPNPMMISNVISLYSFNIGPKSTTRLIQEEGEELV